MNHALPLDNAHPEETPHRSEQWGAGAALLAIAFGMGGLALERPWPAGGDAFTAFLAQNRGAIVGQSLFFMVGSAINLWFLGSLRSYLARAEGGGAPLTHVAFGSGVLWVGLNIVGQAPQIVLTLPTQAALDPALARVLADLCFVMLNTANLPLAVMFGAIAVVALKARAFPVWLGVLAAVAGVAALALTFAVAQASGPLAPQGWLTLALYPSSVIWLLPAPIVMMRRIGRALAVAHR
ncbi:MAG: hypothetical protein Q8L48_37345 [Archangium sp.]|nr:hypothetical protein [Archangium sp.]